MWEKRYARLTPYSFTIYTDNPKQNGVLLEALDLDTKNTKKRVVLEPVISEIGVNVASSDLPFVLKIEVGSESTCWPPTSLTFMALSTADRDMWYKSKFFFF